MNSRAILGTVLAAAFVFSMVMNPAFAAGHLAITNANTNVGAGKLNVHIKTAADIPLSGDAGAFGYAVLTDGFNNVLVLVTHLPIDDSSHEDPESGFHTHVLDLKGATNKCKNFDAEVDLVSSGQNVGFDADYKWNISSNHANILNVPTDELGSDDVGGVVAFTVTPVFKGPNLSNLCVDVVGIGTGL